jgi:uncharacterized protein (TIGR02118 family)
MNMSSQSNITVLYQSSRDGNGSFNIEYYVQKHMKLVEKAWQAVGIQAWQVIKFANQPVGSPQPYCAAAIVTFDSCDGAERALQAEETREVFGDVPNFTNLTPLLMTGGVYGSWAISSSGQC